MKLTISGVTVWFLSVATSSAFVVNHRAATRASSCSISQAKKNPESTTDGDKKEGMDPAKRAALDGVLSQIERNYGRGSIVKLGDCAEMNVSTIRSGALTLDVALGSGYPKGRIVEIYGPESSGRW